MGAESKIEWCDHTFNPWIGCTRVSAACDHCYAEALARRYGWAKWGPGEDRRRTSVTNWMKPYRWNDAAARAGKRARVFCASLADVFDAEVPDRWRLELFHMIHATPSLDWLLLTKRPKLMAKWAAVQGWPANAWAGTTIENRKLGKERAWWLVQVPAPVRFWSVEPLLEDLGNLVPLCFYDTIDGRRRAVDWVIAGGESGPGARPMHPDWARSLRDHCQAAGVPFFFKQWGEWLPPCQDEGQISYGGHRFHLFDDADGLVEKDTSRAYRVGKKAAGRMLDGREWNEFPQVTQQQRAGEPMSPDQQVKR